PQTGFAMALVRMLAFKSAGTTAGEGSSAPARASRPAQLRPPIQPTQAARQPVQSERSARPESPAGQRAGQTAGAGERPRSPAGADRARAQVRDIPAADHDGDAGMSGSPAPGSRVDADAASVGGISFDGDWSEIAAQVPANGLSRQF